MDTKSYTQVEVGISQTQTHQTSIPLRKDHTKTGLSYLNSQEILEFPQVFGLKVGITFDQL